MVEVLLIWQPFVRIFSIRLLLPANPFPNADGSEQDKVNCSLSVPSHPLPYSHPD